MTKYILWDNDGVLVDTEYWYFKSTQRALGEIGVELTQTNYLAIMSQGKSSWDLAQAAGIDATRIAQKQSERNAYYQHYLRTENLEISGVVPLLEQLSKKYRMAIVTTSKRVDFDILHEGRDIIRFMDFVLTREDYTNSKPDPEPYQKALSIFAADTSEALVVEDSERGLRAAIAAGIDCAVVYNEFTKTHNFSGATFMLEDIAGVAQVLRESTL